MLKIEDLKHVDWGGILFVGALMLVVRPISVFVSTLNSGLHWKEKAFLSWMAPRGIVAAAMASLFSLRLEPIFPTEAGSLVATVFLVIIGTVAVYGASAGPLARKLGIAHPDPQGVLFVGAHAWARSIALSLKEHNVTVLLVDTNGANVQSARAQGLDAEQVNVLSEGVMDQLDLTSIGRLLALTPNDEVNALSVLHFLEIYDSAEVFQLSPRKEAGFTFPRHLRGRRLFGPGVTYTVLNDRMRRGAEIVPLRIPSRGAPIVLEDLYDESTIPLFILHAGGQVVVCGDHSGRLAITPTDTVIAMVGPAPDLHAEDDAIEQEEALPRRRAR